MQNQKKRRKFEKNKKGLKLAAIRCTKPNCYCPHLECVLVLACSGLSDITMWHHISDCEHVCNLCHDSFIKNSAEGLDNLISWKVKWEQNNQSEPNLKLYITEELLPYWIKCSKCGKWRKMVDDLPSVDQDNWSCMQNLGISCASAEDPAVDYVTKSGWLERLTVPPLLKKSPAEPYLIHYYSDGCGMSSSPSSDNSDEDIIAEPVVSDGPLDSYFKPFNQPGQQGKALCFRPDIMEMDEECNFPEFKLYQVFYLALRNLILAMWNLNPKEHLVISSIQKAIVVRGMVRIRYANEAMRILSFFTQRGIINTGILPLNTVNPANMILTPDVKPHITVIGAGIAGLAAARQLKMFGYEVKILEARNRIGGRILDHESFGSSVAKGAQFINGCINNPATLMCKQLDLPLHIIRDYGCELFLDTGDVVTPTQDRRVDLHFNSLLDATAEWKLVRLNLGKMNKTKKEADGTPCHSNISLDHKLKELHMIAQKQHRQEFDTVEKQLLQFHFSNIEYACGGSLHNVSAMWWDQNEEYSQFTGEHAYIYGGYSKICEGLAEGLDVSFEEEVSKIDYTGRKVKIKTQKNEYETDKVIVTLPVAVLKVRPSIFVPSLPGLKEDAIRKMGAGCIEKIALKFSRNFWKDRIKGGDFFGHVPVSSEVRGLFAIFYDLNPGAIDGPHVLMSVISGEALNFRKHTADVNVMRSCYHLLRQIFGNSIPFPEQYWITNWSKDPYSLMSYSYMKVGSSGKDYDVMAMDVKDKVYFAGEGTNRRFPQTVTGAYLSGIREACKIVERGFVET